MSVTVVTSVTKFLRALQRGTLPTTPLVFLLPKNRWILHLSSTITADWKIPADDQRIIFSGTSTRSAEMHLLERAMRLLGQARAENRLFTYMEGDMDALLDLTDDCSEGSWYAGLRRAIPKLPKDSKYFALSGAYAGLWRNYLGTIGVSVLD